MHFFALKCFKTLDDTGLGMFSSYLSLASKGLFADFINFREKETTHE